MLIVLMFLGSFVWYPKLPQMIPMHWNVLGEIDNYWPKQSGVLFLPVLTLIMYVSFLFIPKLDPKKEKYHLFSKEWEIIQTAIVGFMAYIQFVIIYLSLNPLVSILPLMFIGLGTLFILIGNYMSKIRQNYFIGVKTPWTLASEDNWNKTHRFASWTFVMAGIITLAEAYFLWFSPVIIFSCIMLASFSPIIYSFLLYKKAGYKK